MRKVSERLEAPGEGNIPGGSRKNKCQFLVSKLGFYLDHSSHRRRVMEAVVPAFACLGTLASSKERLAQRVLTVSAFRDALSLGIPGSRTECVHPIVIFLRSSASRASSPSPCPQTEPRFLIRVCHVPIVEDQSTIYLLMAVITHFQGRISCKARRIVS